MIYQRMIDNALWGFVQPKDGWEGCAEQMKLAEEEAKRQRLPDDDSDFALTLTTTRTKFDAVRQASLELDPVLRIVNDPYADMFATNEPDESVPASVLICFGGTTFDDCLDTLGKLLARFEECRISVSIFCQSKVDFLSHEVLPEGIRADPMKMTAMTKLLRFIQDFAVYGAALYQLKEDDFFERGDLAAAKESFTALQRKNARRQTTSCSFLRTSLQGCRDVLEKIVLALLLLLKVCYTQLTGKTLHAYTRFSTLEWAHKASSQI
ncbi:hypothetical protein PHMEG_00032531 [Phytophthora megakarya]|uniref:Uncharacterized protein n=1 Tax=Phytophthora megakarya TaxID=4795 RepID=A0A225UUL4_9STRA|nr:hypothetical protein PHMEG_00032531 [Phytophthora megakarya]